MKLIVMTIIFSVTLMLASKMFEFETAIISYLAFTLAYLTVKEL